MARGAPTQTKAASRSAPTPIAATIVGLVQPSRVAVDDAPDDAEQADAREGEAGEVELAGGPVALAQAERREREQREADRDVDPEDPVPVDALDDGATDQRAERDGEPADAPQAPSARPRRSGGRRR